MNSLEVLDHVRLNFSASGLFFLNTALAFVMFGVALDIRADDFREVFQKPKSIITGFIAQFLLLPFLTFILTIIIKPSPTIALGMILVASCPGGNISNFMSSLAKANAALSVSLTAFATLAAIFLTPMNFAIWGDLYIRNYNITSAHELLRPLEIDQLMVFQTVFILLGAPVIAGLVFSQKFPPLTKQIKKPIKIGSILFFLAMVIFMLASNFDHFTHYIHLVFLIVLLHNGLALITGYTISSLLKRSPADRRTITIETGIQNSGLALALMFNPQIFPANLELGGMAIVAAWWGVWHIISGLGMATIWSRKPVLV